MAENEGKIPWYSWIILVFHLGWSTGILLMTHGEVISSAVRWIVTAVFLAITVGLGLYDFIIRSDNAGRDATPFDLWTIPHTLAGVVLGVWYIPLIFVLHHGGVVGGFRVFREGFRGIRSHDESRRRHGSCHGWLAGRRSHHNGHHERGFPIGNARGVPVVKVITAWRASGGPSHSTTLPERGLCGGEARYYTRCSGNSIWSLKRRPQPSQDESPTRTVSS